MAARCLSSILLACTLLRAAEPAVVHHDLTVRLQPNEHLIEIEDRVTLPKGVARRFRLHSGLEVEGIDATGDAEERPSGVKLRTYAAPAGSEVLLRMRGTIHHPLVAEGEEYARSFSRTPGTIGEEGVVLTGASFWIPDFGAPHLTYRLTVRLPEGWDVVSQGRRTAAGTGQGRRTVTWECPHPMEEIYLIAARFTEYSRAAGGVETYAFLRTPDPNLAAKYLETTAQYIEMYRKLIGPYPFSKFALVENFWETGYGMPSFTLLGPKIIRFPFILHSSYPHEILHNWWGNSVYVDWKTGNWCEGLTAYLADHLIKEGQGRGVEYRRDTLKKYRNYVRAGKDFPLSQFRSRHSGATEAVGYGKSAMLFHMLRRQLGDPTFVRGLQQFYRAFRFKQASFADLARVFTEVAGEDLGPFFRQWVDRTGAPQLEMKVSAPQGNRLAVEVRQAQEGEPYTLKVPMAVSLDGISEAHTLVLDLAERTQRFEFELPAKAVRVDLDPGFDLFRRLDRSEIPPTLGELFGAEKVLIILPKPQAGWEKLAKAWSREGQVEVASEEKVEALPADRAVWILGATNRWRGAVANAETVTDEEIAFDRVRLPRDGHSFAYAARHPGNPELSVGCIGGEVAAALPGLARKLPHYGKYSYLAFEGEEPSNVAKGVWPVTESPLVALLGEGARRASLPVRKPLARLAPVFDPERLLGHIRFLAADEMEGRGIGTRGLERAAEYIATELEKAGLKPGGDDGSWFQTWSEPGGPEGKPVTLRNVVAVLPGLHRDWEKQSVVLGAHYDHLGLGWPDARTGNRGQIHNGADDNASGVAVMLELARLLARELQPKRSVVFVAFSGEEWKLKGSRHYARSMRRWPAKAAIGMVNLDTVGRLEGKKLTLLGSGTAREWRHIAMGVGYTTGVEAVCVADDPGGSDQRSFHEIGVPAVQVFTGATEDYHRPGDDIGKIDADGLVKVATFVRETVVYLSERDAALSSSLGTGKAPAPAGGGRRVSLGCVPDFAFAGPGVRVGSVLDGSPAKMAGIQAGDVLLSVNGEELRNLRSLSEALKKRQSGDVIQIHLRRGEQLLDLEARLVAR